MLKAGNMRCPCEQTSTFQPRSSREEKPSVNLKPIHHFASFSANTIILNVHICLIRKRNMGVCSCQDQLLPAAPCRGAMKGDNNTNELAIRRLLAPQQRISCSKHFSFMLCWRCYSESFDTDVWPILQQLVWRPVGLLHSPPCACWLGLLKLVLWVKLQAWVHFLKRRWTHSSGFKCGTWEKILFKLDGFFLQVFI